MIRNSINIYVLLAFSGCTHLLLEELPLLERQTIRLGNNGHNVNNLAELLHDYDVNRAQRVAAGVDEVQSAVNTRVLDVSVAHSSELLAQVGTVLVLDVLDDGVPAVFDKIMGRDS